MTKKILFFAILIIALISVFASCNENHEHVWDEGVLTKEASCWSNGHKTYTCTICGETNLDMYATPSLEHIYVESVAKEASCYAPGHLKYTCSLCGDSYNRAEAIPQLQHEYTESTCTETGRCIHCGQYSYRKDHQYSEIDGTCTGCGGGIKFILPNTPTTIQSTSGYHKSCKIESIKIQRKGSRYELTVIVQSTYHEKGNDYSDSASYGWKLYDEDGLVVKSGTSYTDGAIKVGEKSKETEIFYFGEDHDLQDGKTYRFEILNLS